MVVLTVWYILRSIILQVRILHCLFSRFGFLWPPPHNCTDSGILLRGAELGNRTHTFSHACPGLSPSLYLFSLFSLLPLFSFSLTSLYLLLFLAWLSPSYKLLKLNLTVPEIIFQMKMFCYFPLSFMMAGSKLNHISPICDCKFCFQNMKITKLWKFMMMLTRLV